MTDDVKAAVERDGMPDRETRCPCCGDLCETLYLTWDNEVVGCNECVRAVDAEEVFCDDI